MSILDEAATIIAGDRETDYGTAERNLCRISTMWTAYLGHDVTPRQVAMMMVLLKVSRDSNKPKADNLIDIAGYAALADQLDAPYGAYTLSGLEAMRARLRENPPYDFIKYPDRDEAPDPPVEPPIGTKVRDHDGNIWERYSFGWSHDPVRVPRTWKELLTLGPLHQVWDHYSDVPDNTKVEGSDGWHFIRRAGKLRKGKYIDGVQSRSAPFTAVDPL